MAWFTYTLRVAWNAPGRGYVPAPDGTRSVGVYTDSSATTQVALRQNGQPVTHVRVEDGRATFEADAGICFPDFGDGPFFAASDDGPAVSDALVDAGIDRAEAEGRLLTPEVGDATYAPVAEPIAVAGLAGKVGKGTLSINALDHGVLADGATDDTAAWNTLLGALTAGQRVMLPPGKTSVINAAINVPAAATGASLIGHGATLKLATGAASGTVMLNLNAPGATVEGFTLDGSDVANATGIRPKGARQRLAGCQFVDLVAGGVYIQAGAISDLQVDGCRFSGDGYGVLFDTAATATRVTISGNTFTGGALGDAIEVNTPAGGATNITIVGNTIGPYTSATSSQGIGIGLANVVGATVTGNTITGCANAGIHLEDRTSQVSVVGNRVKDCGRAGVSVQVGAGTIAPSRISIVGNTIEGCLKTASTGGIALEGAVAVTSCTISANIVRGCGRAGATCYGIDLGASGVGHMVTGNIVSNTIGATTAGIRWNGGTDHVISANRCFDDQGTKTQQHGMRVQGVNSSVLVLGNHLTGNLTAPFEEASLSGASPAYVKRYNRPGGNDTPAVLPIVSGAVTDTSFGPVSPLNGSAAIDQSNGRLYFKYNNAWHYVTQTA